MELLAKELHGIPELMTSTMKELRKMDQTSNQLSLEISAEEINFFEKIDLSISKKGSNFDEKEMLHEYNSLLEKKRKLVLMADEQMKKIQSLYDKVDGKIATFDLTTNNISHLFPQPNLELTIEQKKKKKKYSHESVVELNETDSPRKVDPNEPLYCICRQISYGNMVACENPDCAIEWYHFGCVGLKTEPPDPWYCPSCQSFAS